MAAPNYPEMNGVGRITFTNKEMAATICAWGQRRFAELILIKFIKMDSKIGFEISLIVVQAIYLDDV